MKRHLSLVTLVVVALHLFMPRVWASLRHRGPWNLQYVLCALVTILLAAKLGAELMDRWAQPAVLGEMLLGVILGNAYLVGIPWFEMLKGNEVVTIMAEIGVIILLFRVGLEATLKNKLKVGLTSLLVAALGIVAPFLFGWGVAAWLLPTESVYVHVFVGATLTAASVGITARALQDINQLKRIESRIILGAAQASHTGGPLLNV